MSYASNNNAVLIDSCNSLQDLTVLLEVTEDIATTAGTGWSLQLNCYPAPNSYCQVSQLTVLQFIVIVQGGNLAYYIQYWANGAPSTWPVNYAAIQGTTPWLPCWAHDFGNAPVFASISGDTLPRESQLQIELGTDQSGGINAVTFTYTDPDGTAYPAVFRPPELAVHPIVACELNFVGPPGGTATFTEGLTSTRGIVYYSVSSGQLAVQNGGPGAACGEGGYFTAETSNLAYSDINGAPASTVTQTLQQPVNCAVNNLFDGNTAHGDTVHGGTVHGDTVHGDTGRLGQLRQIRDEQVGQSPAGQWLLELLDRNSAHLAVLAESDDDLAGRARKLLSDAADTVRDGRAFDDATIDAALKVLAQAAGHLPPSMHGTGEAGATVLESLRGRTLADGLTTASTTIRPRFPGAASVPAD